MLDANEAFRLAYCEKFPDAFEDGVSNAEGVPTISFEIDL